MEKDTNIFMYTLHIFRIISKKTNSKKKKIHSKFLI